LQSAIVSGFHAAEAKGGSQSRTSILPDYKLGRAGSFIIPVFNSGMILVSFRNPPDLGERGLRKENLSYSCQIKY
jgi:hypothetical protein